MICVLFQTQRSSRLISVETTASLRSAAGAGNLVFPAQRMLLMMSVEHTRKYSWVTARKNGVARMIWIQQAVVLRSSVYTTVEYSL